jgi:hypothetical protein
VAPSDPSDLIFRHPTGSPWDSRYLRQGAAVSPPPPATSRGRPLPIRLRGLPRKYP